MSATHVVGPLVTYKTRCLQRCLVCGEKLIDMKAGKRVLRNGEVELSLPSHFHPGALLRIGGDGPVTWENMGVFGNDPVPYDFCITLVEM